MNTTKPVTPLIWRNGPSGFRVEVRNADGALIAETFTHSKREANRVVRSYKARALMRELGEES